MAKQNRKSLKEGRIVWIPCETKEGMFPTERYINISIPEARGHAISGFVPTEDVVEGRVRAVITRLVGDSAALLFRGEILSTSNPVTVPTKWLTRLPTPTSKPK